MSKSDMHYKKYICAFIFLILIIWITTLLFMNQALAKAISARCSDFGSRGELNRFLSQHPDFARRLDKDHDGIPCESLQ